MTNIVRTIYIALEDSAGFDLIVIKIAIYIKHTNTHIYYKLSQSEKNPPSTYTYVHAWLSYD